MEDYQGSPPAISEYEAKNIAVRYVSGLERLAATQLEGAMLTTDLDGKPSWFVVFSFTDRENDEEYWGLPDSFNVHVDATSGEPHHIMSL
jgi:hemolysin-activating ACP:hemolysin acyltransferase